MPVPTQASVCPTVASCASGHSLDTRDCLTGVTYRLDHRTPEPGLRRAKSAPSFSFLSVFGLSVVRLCVSVSLWLCPTAVSALAMSLPRRCCSGQTLTQRPLLCTLPCTLPTPGLPQSVSFSISASPPGHREQTCLCIPINQGRLPRGGTARFPKGWESLSPSGGWDLVGG